MVVNVSIVMFLIQGLLADRILIKDLLVPERREVISLIIILNQLLLMFFFRGGSKSTGLGEDYGGVPQTEQPSGFHCASVSERTSSKSGSSRKSGASTLAATARSRAAVSDSKWNPEKKIRQSRKPGKTKNQRANSGLSSFLYANANGYRSKKESIDQIIE